MDVKYKYELSSEISLFLKLQKKMHVQTGLTPPHFFILYQILLSGGSVYPSDLSVHSNVSRSAITQILNSMENDGYIKRTLDKTDRRKMCINITGLGKNILKKAQEHSDNKVKELVEELGEENTKEVIKLFKIINQVYNR